MSTPQRTRYSLSVVIPAYNEEANIEVVVLETLQFLRSMTDRYEILVTDDASSDRTGVILDHLQAEYPDAVRIFHHKVNTGTNVALAEMFKKARHELVFFLPADRQILCSSISDYVAAVEEGADVVQGWRAKRVDPGHRWFFNWLYRFFLKLFLGVSYHDASASDMYKKVILDQIEFDSRGRLLQAEIVFKAACLGYKIKEIEVKHYPRTAGKQTGINAKTAWLSLMDLLRVAPKLRRFKKLAARNRSVLTPSAS